MRAAWYTTNGEVASAIQTGVLDEVKPEADEVQIEMFFSGISQADIKKRIMNFEEGVPYPIVIPDNDGAGIIRKTGKNIPAFWKGKKVLCFGAQSFRPFGTAAEFCCVPLSLVMELKKNTSMRQAAQMGTPATTGYRAVHILNDPKGKTILVQGGAGAVSQCAIQFAKRAGANVIATVNKRDEVEKAIKAGASEVFILTPRSVSIIRERYPKGVDHIIEVAFCSNLLIDLSLLKIGGSIAAYAVGAQFPEIDLNRLLFDNITFHFLDCDNFQICDKRNAIEEAIKALDEGWEGLEIGEIFKLEKIAQAHEYIENNFSSRCALLTLK